MKTLRFPLASKKSWRATFDDNDRVVSLNLSAVTVEDIIHGLSQVNRFCGQTPTPYSVGEHSVRMVWAWNDLEPQPLNATQVLACLLHDAPEALGVADCNGPLKKIIARPVRHFEHQLSAALWAKLGNPGGTWEQVWTPRFEEVDHAMGYWEGVVFGFDMGDPPEGRRVGLCLEPYLMGWTPKTTRGYMGSLWGFCQRSLGL